MQGSIRVVGGLVALALLGPATVANAAPPTPVAAAQVSSWTSPGASKTATLRGLQPGDVVMAYGLTEDQVYSESVSGGGLAWTQRQQVDAEGHGRAYAWTATADASGDLQITFTRGGGSDGRYGGGAIAYRGSTGIGSSDAVWSAVDGAPSLDLVTTGADSAVVVAGVDWHARDGAKRKWRTGAGPATELAYATEAGRYTAYAARHANAGAAGSKTVGLPAPGGQKYSAVAVEIKGGPGCDRRASPSNFTALFRAAAPGETICLASGNYGPFGADYKQVTLKEQNGAHAVMNLNLNQGDGGVTFDGISFDGGDPQIGLNLIINDVRDVTIRNSEFLKHLRIDNVVNSNILIEDSSFNHIYSPRANGYDTARVALVYGDQCSPANRSGITIRDSEFVGGNSDGIQTGCGIDLIDNEFRNICYDASVSPNHTDMVQLNGAPGAVVRGNLFLVTTCPNGDEDVQMLSGFDGIDHALIEDNVVWGTDNPWAISLYSDNGSVVRHNTLEATGRMCAFKQPCGQIEVTSKDGGSPWPAGNDRGVGTEIYDNVIDSIALNDAVASVARQDHNMVRRFQYSALGDFLGTPQFVGGEKALRYDDFRLAAGSPGSDAASDGLAVGIR